MFTGNSDILDPRGFKKAFKKGTKFRPISNKHPLRIMEDAVQSLNRLVLQVARTEHINVNKFRNFRQLTMSHIKRVFINDFYKGEIDARNSSNHSMDKPLVSIQSKLIIVAADKAADNCTSICKNFHIQIYARSLELEMAESLERSLVNVLKTKTHWTLLTHTLISLKLRRRTGHYLNCLLFLSYIKIPACLGM